MVNLDASAGARMMWPNKNPPLTVFMDKNVEAWRPPDVFGCWEHLPFKDDIFETVFFDPPHKLGRTTGRGFWATPSHRNYYGSDLPKIKFRVGVYRGTREFLRVAKRLCFKWNDIELSIERVLSLFPKEWKEVYRKVIDKGLKTKTLTFWITFERTS